MVPRLTPGVIIMTLAVLCADPALAQQQAQVKREAIQKRRYEMANELKLALAFLPVDPYQKGYAASLSYTRHLNDYWAWEIFQASGTYYLSSTELRDSLLDVWGAEFDDFAAPRFMVTTGIELTPFYGKWALFNDAVVYNNLLFGVYAGVIFGDRKDANGNFDVAKTLEDFRPSIGPGIGFRFFLSEVYSVRADWRTFFSYRFGVSDDPQRAEREEGLNVVMLITASLSWNFGVDR